MLTPVITSFLQFVDKFNEAKQAAKELMKERQLATQKLQEQDKPHPPAGSSVGNTSVSTSPPVKSPTVVSPPAAVTTTTTSSIYKSPSPSISSPGVYTPPSSASLVGAAVTGSETGSGTGSGGRSELVEEQLVNDLSKEKEDVESKERKSSKEEKGGILNGSRSPQLQLSNGHSVVANEDVSLHCNGLICRSH